MKTKANKRRKKEKEKKNCRDDQFTRRVIDFAH